MAAGGAFWLFYSVLKVPFLGRSSTHRLPRTSLMLEDIKLSVSSAVLLALLAALVMIAYQAGYTRIYQDPDQYGWPYLGVSFLIVLALQDTYFYFTHRLIHRAPLFRWMHYGHHRSRVPTPWTSFAFDPPEALMHGCFFVGLVFLMPLHMMVLMTVLLTMTVWSICTHLGFRLGPLSQKSGLVRGLVGPAHHEIHHRKYQVHFGLYFTFWDRVMGTTDPEYGKWFSTR